jgi:hypothetical protein
MAYLPRHESHKKKKSKSPYIFLFLILILGILAFSQERKIRLMFTKDQRQKIERQKTKIQTALEKNELNETFVRDFHTYSVDYIDKEPMDPSAIHFRSRAFYYNLLLTGLHFDSSSLISQIDLPISHAFGNTIKTKTEFDSIFRYARMAESIRDQFPEYESNRFLIFLSEAYREKMKFTNIYKEYSQIPISSLEPEFHHPFVWLLIYSSVRSGSSKDLGKLLDQNRSEGFLGKILLTEREENFLNGMCNYFNKEYVPSLNYLRKVKTENPDFITQKALITEARIFYAQNLHQKAVDLLSVAYDSSKEKNLEYKTQLRDWITERPNLKTNVNLTETIVDPSDDANDE